MVISESTLNALTEQAKNSPRLRQHLTLHQGNDEPSQRVVCAMEPGSYMQPHRHFSDPKQECFLGVRGEIAVITFDNDGRIKAIFPLSSESGVSIVQVEPEDWHTLVSLETGTVFFETKKGPYASLQDIDIAPWAPGLEDKRVRDYVTNLECAARSSLRVPK